MSKKTTRDAYAEASLDGEDELPEELDFEKDDERSGRIGDRRADEDLRDEFPPERVRQAGFTGGSMRDHDVTADDLSPETLLDDDPSRTPGDRDRLPSDSVLTEVEEWDIGAGEGLDEAEEARGRPDAVRGPQ